MRSPYFPLFIYFSSLAHVVIDEVANTILFTLNFISLLFLIIFDHYNYYTGPIYPWEHVISITISILLTAYILISLTHFVEKGMKGKILQHREPLEKILSLWQSKELIRGYKRIHSGYRIYKKTPDFITEKINSKDIIVLLPYCLRYIGCPKREIPDQIKETNSICDQDNCHYFKDENCNAGSIIQYLNGKGIYWKFVGHGHAIDEIFESYKIESEHNPYAVIGISCFNSFSEHAIKVITQNIAEEILFIQLESGFFSCPSFLRIEDEEKNQIDIRREDQGVTSINANTVRKFLSSVLN